jgi:hypothetical protein
MFTIFRKAPPSVVSGYGKRYFDWLKVNELLSSFIRLDLAFAKFISIVYFHKSAGDYSVLHSYLNALIVSIYIS